MRLSTITGLLTISCLLSLGACEHKPDRRAVIGPASAQCTVDCVSVTKPLLKECADSLDEIIRLRAALEQERKRR